MHDANVAALSRDDAYLRAWSLLHNTEEFQLYRDACDFAFARLALSIARCLKRYGHIDQDPLAAAFAREYTRDPRRGYGGTAHGILRAIGEGTSWQTAAGRVFDGRGSCGNGGAMRAAPIGAGFADDLNRVIAEAKASAAVTHAHPDGQTGSIAVALAAAWMVREGEHAAKTDHELIRFIREQIPQTETYYRLKKPLELPLELSPRIAASVLGNGSQVISSDTVPFCLGRAARHATDYTAAIWTTVHGLGDGHTVPCNEVAPRECWWWRGD